MEYEKIQHRDFSGLNLFLNEITSRTPHMHREFELVLVLSGVLHLTSLEVDQTLAPGALAVLNPWRTHAFRGENSSSTCLFIQISPDLFRDYYPNAAQLRFQNLCLSEAVPPQICEVLRSTMQELALRFLKRKPAYEFACMQRVNALMEQLLLHAGWELISSEQGRRDAVVQQRLERVMQFVQEHHGQKLFLKELAEQEHLSESYLTHFVHKHLNMSFQDYVSLIRMEHAAQLLTSTQDSIAEICQQCGFSDRRYMNKAFLEFTGKLPREYRSSGLRTEWTRNSTGGLSRERVLQDAEAVAYLQSGLFG
jgi:AraC-like DNA-binding protein